MKSAKIRICFYLNKFSQFRCCCECSYIVSLLSPNTSSFDRVCWMWLVSVKDSDFKFYTERISNFPCAILCNFSECSSRFFSIFLSLLVLYYIFFSAARFTFHPAYCVLRTVLLLHVHYSISWSTRLCWWWLSLCSSLGNEWMSEFESLRGNFPSSVESSEHNFNNIIAWLL